MEPGDSSSYPFYDLHRKNKLLYPILVFFYFIMLCSFAFFWSVNTVVAEYLKLDLSCVVMSFKDYPTYIFMI